MLNQEDIIRMAREAGFDTSKMAQEAGFLCEEDWAKHGLQKFERFANLVAAHEREECAKFCRDTHGFYGFGHVFATGIRARGQK